MIKKIFGRVSIIYLQLRKEKKTNILIDEYLKVCVLLYVYARIIIYFSGTMV